MRVREMGRHRCVGDGNIYWTHAAKQSIITRSWINVQTATKAFANARGLAGIYAKKVAADILSKIEIGFLKVNRAPFDKCTRDKPYRDRNHSLKLLQFNSKPPRSV